MVELLNPYMEAYLVLSHRGLAWLLAPGGAHIRKAYYD